MSDRGEALRRYLGSRKNIAGMIGALAGVGLYLAFGIEPWPVLAAALYGVGALVGPRDPDPKDASLTEQLRGEAADLAARIRPRSGELPAGAVPAVTRMLDVLRIVLDRLDQVAAQQEDRAAAPERLAIAAEIIRTDLPSCLDTYLGRSPSASTPRAAAELVTQLDLIAGAVDRLAGTVPDVDVENAEELTRELRRRHGAP